MIKNYDGSVKINRNPNCAIELNKIKSKYQLLINRKEKLGIKN